LTRPPFTDYSLTDLAGLADLADLADLPHPVYWRKRREPRGESVSRRYDRHSIVPNQHLPSTVPVMMSDWHT
jgi:hypothetical protein